MGTYKLYIMGNNMQGFYLEEDEFEEDDSMDYNTDRLCYTMREELEESDCSDEGYDNDEHTPLLRSS